MCIRDRDMEAQILEAFILAKDSSTIQLPEGHFLFSQSLSLDAKKHITIKGMGMDKTILSFKGQTQGAEGIKVTNSENITIEDLAVEDAAGDNIKVSDTDTLTLRNIRSAWTGEVSTENGAYALYPVLSTQVLIEGCEAIGSSDAGIYVGQSQNVIIRNNKAYYNVAGIESENYSGHSLRSGFATSAAEAGVEERNIMKMTGHKSTQMVRRYIKEANLFKNNALNKIKL